MVGPERLEGGSALWSFDLDGVLAEPPFGWNPAINRDVSLEPAADAAALVVGQRGALDRLLSETWYRFRYVLRPPRSGAFETVRLAATLGRVIVLTGRHERGQRQTEAWLERHGFAKSIDELVMNSSALSSARYKEAYLRSRGASLHIDDDAATVALLARNEIATALVSWPRNRGLRYPEGVTRCDDLSQVSSLIEQLASRD